MLKSVCGAFQILGDFLTAERYGSGHINDTYKVTCNLAGKTVHYLLQRINQSVFPRPDQVQENIVRVTEHLAHKLPPEVRTCRTLTLVPAKDGAAYHRNEAGYWRVYLFVEGASSHDVSETPNQTYQAAKAFAEFQCNLADLPAPRLHETIPGFHDTEKRYRTFLEVLEKDPCNRAAGCKPEIAFLEARAGHCARFNRLLAEGKLPERITHNDTKINNVLLNDATGEGQCVIDLDTVMPGLALNDFGDMCRTGTAAAAEDEQDLSKVACRLDLFEAMAKGYCSKAQAFLNETEKAELPFAPRLITQTIAIRFLTDHLAGDTYFKIHRPNHNLDRFRTQMQMILDMEQKAGQMEKIVQQALLEG